MADLMAADPMSFLRIDPAQMMKEQAKTFDAKKWCWIPTADSEIEGYLAAEIKSASGDLVNVETVKGEKEVKKELCDQMNPPKYEKCVDMANLTYLNEASVLYNLKARYQAGLIYTYSGLFCIAINPYRRLPIYTDQVVNLFRGKRRIEMPPHVFAIVDSAYQDMLIEHDNQSMLITGESGAGKTENTKKVIQYIAKVAGVDKKPEPDAPLKPGEVAKIKGELDEQIVEANPLLEAFGNAKTTRNNNSSRFGKFIRCHFGQTGKLAGADIESYLLEKNRVVHQGAAERNYHIFYQVLYATTDEELAGLCLTTRDAHSFGFLKEGVTHVDRMDDHEEYALTVNAIRVLGFTDEEKQSMLKIIAAILNFGNMKFKQKPRDEQAEVVDPADGEKVAFLLGMSVGDFHKSLVKPKVKVGTEYVNKGQNCAQVSYAISALSKALFERMFWWIVVRVNKALDTKERRSYFIGVLDIAGFEIFDYNSFEQICINLTNEKLQQFFNHHMFVLEQEEYKKEGIFWEFIDFGMDLEETINLIEKPMGIFAMLEEECIVPKATDTTYLTKLHKQHAGKTRAYTKPTPKQAKAGGGDFILHHYAGSVGYSIASWLEKNKDPINENTAQLFAKCTDVLTASLFQDYNPDVTGGRRKGSAFQTVSYRHREQLKSLLTTLMATSPHFVRCIIPNEQKSSTEVEGQLVLHQLRCNGVLEGIRICRKGFPSRMPFNDFRQRYQILAASAIPAGFIDGKIATEKLIEALQLDENEFRIGKTKVFFRSGIVGELEEMRDERLSKIISQFQAYCKGHLMRVEFKKLLDKRIGLAVVQRNIRKFLMLRDWAWWKLYIKVLPLLSIARSEDDMKEKEEELKKAMENAEANALKTKDLESALTDVMSEKERLFNDLQKETNRLIDTEDRLLSTEANRDSLQTSLDAALEKLEGEEHAANSLAGKLSDSGKKLDDINEKLDASKASISKLEGEKASRDRTIEGLGRDVKGLEDNIARITKEKGDLGGDLDARSSQLAASEDRIVGLNKVKTKLEGDLANTQFALQKEKDAKAKLEKDKKKVEGEYKETKEKLADTEAELAIAQDLIAKKIKLIKELEENKESNENLIKQLQKKIAELLARIDELEEELEAERKLRQKVELGRKELETQLEELQEQLETAGGATTAQVEVSKKRELECQRLRKEIEELNVANEDALGAAKTKAALQLSEAQDECEVVKKQKAKVEKEKSAIGNDLLDLQTQLDATKKQKVSSDKSYRNSEKVVSELRAQVSDLEAAVVEAQSSAGKNVGSASSKDLEEAQHKLSLAIKNNKALDAALAQQKADTDVESKAKQDLHLKLGNAIADIDALNEAIEESESAHAELQARLSKANSEAAEWKTKYDTDGASRVEELEDAKRKLAARVLEMEEALSAAETKASGMEKVKNRMNEEVEDLLLDLEKAQSIANSLEKKQKKFDALINEWKGKCDETQIELDTALKNVRNYSADNLKMRSANEDLQDKIDTLKKENKALTAELHSVSEQLSDGGRNSVELEKLRRKLGMENEELQLALEEAEQALEIEEGKLLKIQLEYSQLRQSSDRKLSERDEELESSRKNHQRQIEALQSTIENELKSKTELQKGRKKFESDILHLEAHLDEANRNSNEFSKTVKKQQQQIKELTACLDEEVRNRDDMRDSIGRSEKRANDLAVQIDETRVAMERSERACKLAESDRQEYSDRLAELQTLYNNAANGKRKAESDFHQLQEEIDELENEARSADEKAGKAMGEVARLMAELNAANEGSSTADKSRSILAKQVAELQSQLEDNEFSAGGKGLKAQVRKLEARILELESDLDTEGRKSAEIVKQARKADKRVKELIYQLEDESKNTERSSEAAEKLNAKLIKMRLAHEESEGNNAQWQSKFKKAICELEESEERSDCAEQALQKARQRARSAQSQMSTRGGSRAPSAPRTPRSRTALPEED